MNDQTVVSRAEGWLSAWVGDEMVVMGPETGLYVSLSSTAGRIWELLEAPMSVGELCDRLCSEYEVSGEQARPEVISLLDQLSKHQAIHVQTPALG